VATLALWKTTAIVRLMTDQTPAERMMSGPKIDLATEAVAMGIKGFTLKTASRYRGYAEELRTIATEAWPHSRESLLKAAAEYDQLAAGVEAIVNSKVATGQQTIQVRSH
jgi:hypothetical protein